MRDNPYASPAPEEDAAAGDLSQAAKGGPRPTRTRFVVLGVLCLLAGVLYLDRICISQALPSIKQDLGLTNEQSSYVLMAFTLAYGLFEVPTGRWGDRIGARRVLTRISLWWSAFTALTGACQGLYSLVAVRFLFGGGEAGAFPNVARVLARWFPDHERGRAQGVLLAASQFGGAIAPALAALLIGLVGWRWTFAAFGSLGAVWAAGFYFWFRDDPAEHAQVNAAEAEQIGRRATAESTHAPIPWRLVAGNPSVWMLCLIVSFASFNSYIYFSWFPTYLIKGRGVAAGEAGMMASLVLTLSAVGTLGGGVLLDRFGAGGRLAARRAMGAAFFFSAAVALACALTQDDPWTAAALTAVSCCCAQSAQPLWWTSAIGISGRHVGALFGLMNSMGVIGALCSQYLVGKLADVLGQAGYAGRAQWDPIFYINLAALSCAALLWACFIQRPVEPESEPGLATGGKVEADH